MKKGFALALTLWIVAILSLVSVLYLSYGKKVIRKTALLDKKIEAIFKVESTLEVLKFYGMTADIHGDKFTNKIVKKVFPKFPTILFLDNRPYKWKNQTIKVQDTAGLVAVGDLEGLSSYLTSSPKILKDKKVIIENSIKDWKDENHFMLINGAEDTFYENREFKYGARDSIYIAALDELFLIQPLCDMELDKQELKSKLFLSNYPIRNIITMDKRLLKSLYSFSQIELEQLLKAKEKSLNRFVQLFYQLRPNMTNNETTGVTSSRMVKVTISYKSRDVYEKIDAVVSFRLGLNSASEVLSYEN